MAVANSGSPGCVSLTAVMAQLGVVVFLATPSECARAFFVFGDSLVDNGNNNYLMSTARADSPPYGIEYPTHQATGRFSNGLNIPDIISEHLGAEPTLPYLSPELHGEKLLVGANFASAGVGILNDTGIQFAHGDGEDEQAAALLPLRLYDMGARRVVVTGTGPLGCAPAQLARSRGGECDADLTRAADRSCSTRSCPTSMEELMRDTGAGLSSPPAPSASTWTSSATRRRTASRRPRRRRRAAGRGRTTQSGCAPRYPTSASTGTGMDAYHPTERANRIIVSQFMAGSLDYISPLNLHTNLRMDAGLMD